MNPNSGISLQINELEHLGWSSLNVRRSIQNLCSAFTLSLSHSWSGQKKPLRIEEGQKCSLKLDGQHLLTGYIGSIREISNSSSSTISVGGRDITCDIVDSFLPPESTKRVWNGVKFETILKDLISPFRLKYSIQSDQGAVFNTFAIHDETVFSALDRAAKLRGLLLYTDYDGTIVVSKPKTRGGIQGELVHGKNLLSIERSKNIDNRFSQYVIQSINYGESDKNISNVQILTRVVDPEIKRQRTLLVSPDGYASGAISKIHLEWEKSVRAARSRKITVTVPTWTNSADRLWKLNELVHITSSYFEIDEIFIVSGITYELDGNRGRTTQLELEDPKAHEIDASLPLKEVSMRGFYTEGDIKGGQN